MKKLLVAAVIALCAVVFIAYRYGPGSKRAADLAGSAELTDITELSPQKIGVVTSDGKEYLVDSDKVFVADSMGNKPYKVFNKYVPPRHIPDLRVYDTCEVSFSGYTVYRHYPVPVFDGKPLRGEVMALPGSHETQDHLEYLYRREPWAFAKKHRLLKTTALENGLTLYEYDVSGEAARVNYKWKNGGRYYDERQLLKQGDIWVLKKIRHDPASTRNGRLYYDELQVLKDGKAAIWASARSKYISAERNAGGYTVLTQDGVYYTSRENRRLVSDFYYKDFCNGYIQFRDGGPCPVKSGRMLTDNVARIEYNDGGVTHWKIRFTREERVKNRGTGIKTSVIWHNSLYRAHADHLRDIDPVSSPDEPVYE